MDGIRSTTLNEMVIWILTGFKSRKIRSGFFNTSWWTICTGLEILFFFENSYDKDKITLVLNMILCIQTENKGKQIIIYMYVIFIS